ncbi:hypothetical protein NpPPO83_00005009 [Neofusicoccum parvum]|uniref:Uncharacterized protein n=1 Tax=Neofusicoccum parvum TaxID=310453 RepID=A0ACB5SNN3_9PEZI|nr:hypothetical protein NpPPO83_00005009 [Neofusicoccum parvum]
MEVTLRIIEWLQRDAKTILDIVLGKDIPGMTGEMYEAACGNPFCSKEILAYFFLRYPEPTVRKRIIQNAVLSGDPAFVKTLLSQGLRITLTRRFVIGMSQREGGKGPLMKLLLRSEPQTQITDETAQAVAEHFDHPVFQTLLNRRDFRQEWITAALVSAIQPDRAHGGAGAIRALLRHDAAAALRHVPLRALVAFADAAHVRAHLAGQPRAVVSGDVLLAAVGSCWHTDANSRAVVKLLVERPRSPTPSADAQAALAAAAVARARRQPFLLRLLLGRGLVAPPCGALEVGLRAATAEGNWIVVFMLLDHGVDVDAADGNGDTALKIARRGGHRWLANELVMRGARG